MLCPCQVKLSILPCRKKVQELERPVKEVVPERWAYRLDATVSRFGKAWYRSIPSFAVESSEHLAKVLTRNSMKNHLKLRKI